MSYCNPCERNFPHDRALVQHYTHSNNHHYCWECDRHFQSESNLHSHMNSRLHQPANVPCPGRGCNRCFVSPSALTSHFENGVCPSGITQDKLDRFVTRADTNNYITNPNRLLTGPLGWNEPPAPTTVWATNRSWNGVAFQCFLCNSTYRQLAHLNQHLQSPYHQNKIYRCPKPDCGDEFALLSGLCQHVERGSCGVRMFRQVRDTMEVFTRGFNMLTA
jgi:hypothetical protein